jgi:hypothetical protein
LYISNTHPFTRQALSLAQHEYVLAWKCVQDAFSNALMHLSRKPRFAMPIYLCD